MAALWQIGLLASCFLFIYVPNMIFIVPYRIAESEVQILRVLHGARKWPNGF
jgi:hypothetical protein